MNSDKCRQIIAAVMPGKEGLCFGPISIGSTPDSADEGVKLVLKGVKTATSSPRWDFPDDQIPYRGALSVLLDGGGRARAIVETVDVEIMPFNQISEEFATAYGEGDRNLAWFRSEIGKWYRAYAASSGNVFSESTPIICEKFIVVMQL